MSSKSRLFASAAAAAGAAAAWKASPAYVKDACRGMFYATGMKQVRLAGMGRVTAALLGKPDHPPCFAQMHEHVQYLTGVPPREFYLTDGRKMVEAHKIVSDWYGMDLVLPFTDSYNIEAEALGAKMVYGDLDMPTIDQSQPLVADIRDIDRIEVSFHRDQGRIGYLMAVSYTHLRAHET